MTTNTSKPPSKRAQSRLNRLMGVAYHEAGHAVAAMELGRGFTRISIIPSDEALGCTSFDPQPDWFDPDGGIDDRHRLFIEREVLIDLAGDAAWRRFRGRSNWVGSMSDNHSALTNASRLFGGTGKVIEAYMAYMRQRAMALVAADHCWVRIEALANALMGEKDLSRDRAYGICREALGIAGKSFPGAGHLADDREGAEQDDHAGALADFLLDRYPPRTAEQQFYLVDFAARAVAEIERDLPPG